MHRLFVEPQTLTEDRTVWVGSLDDIRFRHLVDSFREKIRERNWKAIDLSIRLFVKVENWDGTTVLVENLGTRTDYLLASAYLKAGLLEKTPIVVFADDTIPWERLKPLGQRREDKMTEKQLVLELERRANRFFDLSCRYSAQGQGKEANIAHDKGDQLWQARNLIMQAYRIPPR